ncbi:uncharacterized protein LOC114291866 [Camellia sinensis]|uniref:uncharacterized protein LOC114291866 n=1 Tax=Camellia sinensis TaxID=4442 RepID=UPI001035E306|nr:uncharacterized protein LOC114291866 [Camellia sinensis]
MTCGASLMDERGRGNPKPVRRKLFTKKLAPLFSQAIDSADPQKTFISSKFNLYVGKGNLTSHIQHYTQAMTLWSNNGPIMCQMFSSSFNEMPLRWFYKLETRSINDWKQLQQVFISSFITNSQLPKEVDVLLTTKKDIMESLREYNKRYWAAYNEIDNCNEKLAVTSFKLGLQPTSKLRQSLTKKQPTDVSSLMRKMEQHCKIKDNL